MNMEATKKKWSKKNSRNKLQSREQKTEQVSPKTSLSDIKNPGDVFSPLQLHNKHFLENLGYHFYEWTTWIKHFFRKAVVLHINVPWVEFNLLTPVQSAVLKLNDEEKSQALAFSSAAIVKKLNALGTLKKLKILQDTNAVFAEISSTVDDMIILYESLEEVLTKKGTTEIVDGKLVIHLANIRKCKAADVYINLENWCSMTRDDISVTCHVGNVTLPAVTNLFFSIPLCNMKLYAFACALEKLLEI